MPSKNYIEYCENEAREALEKGSPTKMLAALLGCERLFMVPSNDSIETHHAHLELQHRIIDIVAKVEENGGI